MRDELGVVNVPLFTTSTCFPLDGSTKALRPHALRKRRSLKTLKTQGINVPKNSRQHVPPRPDAGPRLRLIHLLSVRHSSHSHPHSPPSPPQPSSSPCKFTNLLSLSPTDQLTTFHPTVRIWSSQLQDSFPRRQKSHLARMLRYLAIGNLRMASRCRAPWRSRRIRGRF